MEQELENELERLGLGPIDKGRYWHIHCPFHDDHTRSAQCFRDGWIHCHAGCKRRHINSIAGREVLPREATDIREQEPSYDTGDFTELWMGLEPTQQDIKGVPAALFRKAGWKEWPGDNRYATGIFIPYFDAKRERVLFFQIRHPDGAERRFSFPSGYSPTIFGLDALKYKHKYLLVTEGSRDSIILRGIRVPAVAMPSASSAALIRILASYCRQSGTILVWAGDNDDAGRRLQDNINIPYIDAHPNGSKDIGDLYAAKGIKGVIEQYGRYQLGENPIQQSDQHLEEATIALTGKNRNVGS